MRRLGSLWCVWVGARAPVFRVCVKNTAPSFVTRLCVTSVVYIQIYVRRKESSAGSHTVCTKVREKEIEWEGTTGAEEEERRARRGRRYGVLDLFSRTTVEQNGLKLWGSGAFFLPPQGMYYPVSDYFIFL